MVGALAALLLLSLSHQLITSSRRRHRDLAVLRALGADDRWVSSILHWQVTFLVVAVAVAALQLGVAAGRVAYSTYIDRIGVRTDPSVPYAQLAAILVILLALGNLAAVAPARRARRTAPGRVLADE
ncbi:MAG: FtsX-like permease family protein [Acidimicrobiales bacterium]